MTNRDELQDQEAGSRDALARAEEILDAIHQPFLLLDGTLRIRSANREFYRVFGGSEAHTEGAYLFQLDAGQWDVPELRQLLDGASSALKSDGLELRHRFVWAGEKTLRVRVSNLRPGPGGTPLTLLAIEDLTDRPKAQRASSEGEDEERSAVDAAPAIIAYVDCDLHFRMVNKAYERWFGVAPADLIGKSVSDLFDAAQVAILRPKLDRVLAGETVSFEEEYASREGPKILQVTYTPDRDAAGKLQGFTVLGNDITGRKQVEMAVRRSEESWRGLFERMVEGFFIAELLFDATGAAVDCRFMQLNPAFEKQSGLRDVKGRTLRELVPQIQDELIEAYARVVRTGVSEQFELCVPALKSNWFEVRAWRTEGASFAVLFLNITERKRDEEQLRDNEKRQAALVSLGDRLRDAKDIATAMGAAMEIAGTVLHLARAGYGVVDASQEYVRIDSDWTDGRTATLAGTYRFKDFGSDLGGSLQRGEVFIADDVNNHQMTERDSARWKALDIRAVVNLPLVENGRLTALLFAQDTMPRVWTEADVTFLRKLADRTWAAAERAKALQDLQESEAFTRSILASSPDCVKVLGLDGRVLTINETGCLQMEIEDVSKSLNQPWADFWGDHREQALQALQEARNGQAGRFEGFCATAKGKPKWWEVVVTPIRDASGKPFRLLSLSRDITERKLAGEERDRLTLELQRSNEELSQFAHTVAHDLQSPLRGVTSFAQLLRRNGSGRLLDKDLEFVDHIVASARRMAELVASLLQFAQVGQGVVSRNLVEMEAVLDDAIETLRLQIEEQGATVTRGAMPVVTGDAIQLKQVLQNLIANALKYRRQDVPPDISVRAEVDGSFYVFSIRDNGEGIASEYLRTIFEPLRRLHGSEIPGSGLGLAMCQRVIQRHGGRLWAESQVGVGSTFFFTLPASA